MVVVCVGRLVTNYTVVMYLCIFSCEGSARGGRREGVYFWYFRHKCGREVSESRAQLVGGVEREQCTFQ